jgi:hypothetical protein
MKDNDPAGRWWSALAAFASAAAAFLLSYYYKRDIGQALLLTGKVILPLFLVLVMLRSRRRARANSGMTKEEFMVAEAGGPLGAAALAKRYYLLGWVFSGSAVLVTALCALKSASLAIVFGVIVGAVLLPLATVVFWYSWRYTVLARKHSSHSHHVTSP